MQRQRKAASGWQARAAAAVNNTPFDATKLAPKTQRYEGRRTVTVYIGQALRHCRRATELNLRDGPTADVAASVQYAREALDGATFVCEYVAAAGES